MLRFCPFMSVGARIVRRLDRVAFRYRRAGHPCGVFMRLHLSPLCGRTFWFPSSRSAVLPRLFLLFFYLLFGNRLVVAEST